MQGSRLVMACDLCPVGVHRIGCFSLVLKPHCCCVQVRDALSFPVDELLDMAPYMAGLAPPTGKRPCGAGCRSAAGAHGAAAADGRYQLHCVIEHIGRTMHGGHYVAYVRQGARWLKCDDLRISEVRVRHVVHVPDCWPAPS
jgi:Ubiquitin carboxyl-terminal hydrolase